MDIRVYGLWARKRKSLLSLGIDIGPGVVVIALLFWNILIRFKSAQYGRSDTLEEIKRVKEMP